MEILVLHPCWPWFISNNHNPIRKLHSAGSGEDQTKRRLLLKLLLSKDISVKRKGSRLRQNPSGIPYFPVTAKGME